MSDPNEKVIVRISASERVVYEAEVTMTRAEFEHLDKVLEEAGIDDEPAERIINRYIDKEANWLDDSDYEIDTFEIVEPEPELTDAE